MSGVDPGTYYITNVVPVPFGGPLAVTLADVNAPLIVSGLWNDSSQRWRIDGNSGQPQMISADSDPYIHACTLGRYVGGVPGSECTWLIFPTLMGDGFHIVDTGESFAWAINSPTEGVPVFTYLISGTPLQTWEFTPA